VHGLQVELGGQIFAAFKPPTSEVIGLAFAIVILILAFGSVLAMGLPVAVALTGIGIGGALVILFSHIVQVPEFAPFIGVMIGLGVGIDYALLIVTRYREQLHANHTVRESVQIAIDTAGRSVLFAGITVVISLLGMLLMGVGFVQGLAVSAAATVAITVLASLTLLPALLGFAGPRIEKRRRAGLIAAGLVAVGLLGVGFHFAPLLGAFALAAVVVLAGFFVPALKSEVEHRPPRPRRETLAYRWSRGIQHRPWLAALSSALVLLILAVPVLHLRLAFSDESNYPSGTTTKKAYNLLVAGFGKGYNGPILLVTESSASASPGALDAVKRAVDVDPNVVFVSDPVPNNPQAPTALLWNVVPRTGPQEEATTQLVNRLRKHVLPPLESSLGSQIQVTGFTAANTDFAHILSSRMPYFFLAVLALSFLLLMAVFRSLLVPLKAVIMNLLSIGASYGIVVALFQWGWFGKITHLSAAPIEPWAPMMLFAIVFGLSMDYEVFLLSRVREEWLRTGDSHTSVADGLAATAKVITAAAAIMVVVFGAFIFESDRTTKLMGTGLGLAILLDATVVRMLLVPATMELLGDRNWWLPKWLDRILPNVSVEGTSDDVALLDPEERVLQPT
ncbi:MAG: putative drug exporter of the superfamily, partial [Actinomycetota bacterium]